MDDSMSAKESAIERGEVLVLTTAEVSGLVDAADCVDVIDAVLREPAALSQQTLPRRRLYMPVEGEESEYYWHNNMAGAFLGRGTLAVRLDVSRTRIREERQEFPGDFTGLVLLYDLATSHPYAIIHDHGLSPLRVAATSAVATRELAPSGSSVLGIIGTGEQARAHALTHRVAMPGLTTILYYSRSADNRDRAAAASESETGIEAVGVGSVEELIARSHVVIAATNATEPVFDGHSLQPGQHLVSLASSDGFAQRREIDETSIERSALIVVNSKTQIIADRQGHYGSPSSVEDLHHIVELTDVLSGRAPGRTSDEQITLYDNNVGMGIQFAALGALTFEKAVAAGLGTPLPADLFVTRKSAGELYAP